MSSILEALRKQEKPKRPFRPVRPPGVRKPRRLWLIQGVGFFLAGAGVVFLLLQWMKPVSEQRDGAESKSFIPAPEVWNKAAGPMMDFPSDDPKEIALQFSPTATVSLPTETPIPVKTPTETPTETRVERPPAPTMTPTPEEQPVLNGVLFNREAPMAIINGKIYGVGDRVGGRRILDIQEDGVQLEGWNVLLKMES